MLFLQLLFWWFSLTLWHDYAESSTCLCCWGSFHCSRNLKWRWHIRHKVNNVLDSLKIIEAEAMIGSGWNKYLCHVHFNDFIKLIWLQTWFTWIVGVVGELVFPERQATTNWSYCANSFLKIHLHCKRAGNPIILIKKILIKSKTKS